LEIIKSHFIQRSLKKQRDLDRNLQPEQLLYIFRGSFETVEFKLEYCGICGAFVNDVEYLCKIDISVSRGDMGIFRSVVVVEVEMSDVL